MSNWCRRIARKCAVEAKAIVKWPSIAEQAPPVKGEAAAMLAGAWADGGSTPIADIRRVMASMHQPKGPRPLIVHPRVACWLEIVSNPPHQRPLDYDAWKPNAVRQLLCSRCGVHVSRNSPRRWGNPYCGPCWPGEGRHLR